MPSKQRSNTIGFHQDNDGNERPLLLIMKVLCVLTVKKRY